MSSSYKITRPDIDPNNLYGFVLQRSDLLTLIAEVDDFFLDGYKTYEARRPAERD